jgi:hypothetical protein
MPKFIIPADIPRCHHIKTNGVRCGSPSLHNQRFCYFHTRIRQQEQRRRRRKATDLDFPFFEDATSVQWAIVQVTRALVEGKLDTRTAGLLLYALQTASLNLKSMHEPEWMDIESDVLPGPDPCAAT